LRQPAGKTGLVEQASYGGSKSRGVIWRYQQSGPPMLDDLGESLDVARHDGLARHLGFHRDVPEGLNTGGDKNNISSLHEGGHFLAESGEVHAVDQTQVIHQARQEQAFLLVAAEDIPHQREINREASLAQEMKCLDRDVLALSPRDPTHHDEMALR
jgi:hypothetical protein